MFALPEMETQGGRSRSIVGARLLSRAVAMALGWLCSDGTSPVGAALSRSNSRAEQGFPSLRSGCRLCGPYWREDAPSFPSGLSMSFYM